MATQNALTDIANKIVTDVGTMQTTVTNVQSLVQQAISLIQNNDPNAALSLLQNADAALEAQNTTLQGVADSLTPVVNPAPAPTPTPNPTPSGS